MFGKSGKPETQTLVETKTKNTMPSIISAGLNVVGNLTSDGEVHVDGIVNGDILADQLTVGSGAQITGHIEADVAMIRGHVNGIIRARSVTLASTARVIGDIVHEDLAIETGAQMEGHCRRRTKEDAAQVRSTTHLTPDSGPTNGPNKPAVNTAIAAAQ